MRTVLPCTLATLLVVALACGGDDVPEPWSERHGEQQEVVGNEGPGTNRVSAEEAAPRPAQPTTTKRVERQAPADLPPVDEAYPQVGTAGGIERCPGGTFLHREPGKHAEQYCLLEGTDDLKHGPYVSFWGNGVVHEVGPYRGGQRHGLWTEWHRNGRKAGTWRWTEGQPGGKVADP